MHNPRTHWPVATRVQYVVGFLEVRKRVPTLSGRQFCAASEVPYSTFARWLRTYQREGRMSLVDRPTRPRRSPTALHGAVLDVVRNAHRRSGLGVRRLYALLCQRELISCSLSSVYRILARAGALVRKPRKRRPNWIRYARMIPGERAQMDLKYLPNDRYMVTLVDDCSRYLAAAVLEARTCGAVCQALPGLLAQLPFSLRCIQTDNGPEFASAFTSALAASGIRHARIRPRTPHLNGKVERVQRTVAEEYWDGVTSESLDAWKRGLARYLRFYNDKRLHSALGCLPPAAYAQRRLSETALSHLS
jgi:transposase InsO family protein